MAKNYDTPLDQMKAISWQLKRIADQLEILNDNLSEKQQPEQSIRKITAMTDSSKMRNFLNNLKE